MNSFLSLAVFPLLAVFVMTAALWFVTQKITQSFSLHGELQLVNFLAFYIFYQQKRSLLAISILFFPLMKAK